MIMLDLFAGAGGAACGYSRVGWEHLACVDFDADCVATLCAAGLPGVQARVEDVGSYWHGEPVTFCHASPPCQPFSQAGKGLGEDDSRDGFPALWAALDAVRPTWLAVEQVPALTFQTHRAYFSWVLAEVGARFAWLDWRILDAADFGVPQHRRRLLILAGPGPVRWPRPTHDRPDRCALTWRRPWVTVREALGLGSCIGGGTRRHGMAEWRPRELADEPAAVVSGFGSTGALYTDSRHPPAVPDNPGPFILDRPAPAVTAQEVKGTRASAKSGGTFHGGPNRASDALYVGTGRRRLTWQECAKLQAFPDDWPLTGTITSRYRQVGNAVCPPVAEAIGRSVLDVAQERAA